MTWNLRVRNTGQTFAVDPAHPGYVHHAPSGSLLSVLLENGIELDHACGGVGACATCHVRVTGGASSLRPPDDAEEDMLDQAPGVRDDSRLACRCFPDGSADLDVDIPDWNRNQVREGR